MRWLGCFILLAAAAVRGAPAGGADAAPETPTVLLERAQGALGRGDFEDARADANRLLGLTADPSLLGPAHLLLGQCLAARRQFPAVEGEFVKALQQDPLLQLDPARVDPFVVSLLESVRRRLHGELVVTPSDAGAQVSLDHLRAGTAPLRRAVGIGLHEVSLEAPGAPAVSRTVLIHANEVVTVSFPPAGAIAQPASGQAPVPESAAPNAGLVPLLEARVDFDVNGGVALEAGGGMAYHWLWTSLAGIWGAAPGSILRLGARFPRILGPVGVYASADALAFFHRGPVFGGGVTGGLSCAVGPRFELFAEGSGRWLRAEPGFRTHDALASLGGRVLFP